MISWLHVMLIPFYSLLISLTLLFKAIRRVPKLWMMLAKAQVLLKVEAVNKTHLEAKVEKN
jgi:hypothetical protein